MADRPSTQQLWQLPPRNIAKRRPPRAFRYTVKQDIFTLFDHNGHTWEFALEAGAKGDNSRWGSYGEPVHPLLFVLKDQVEKQGPFTAYIDGGPGPFMGPKAFALLRRVLEEEAAKLRRHRIKENEVWGMFYEHCQVASL